MIFKNVIFNIFIFSFSAFLSLVIIAHPGKTDSEGGHIDRDSGEYHYHHGYPAHSHSGGVCPYDFDDKTGQSSSPQADNHSDRANITNKNNNDTSDMHGFFQEIEGESADSEKNTKSSFFKESPLLGFIVIILGIAYILYLGYFIFTPIVIILLSLIKTVVKKIKSVLIRPSK